MKKIAIIYGDFKTSLQKRAVEELSTILLDYTLEYPVCVQYGKEINTEEFRAFYIGTKQNNGYIALNSTASLSCEESYAITVKNDTVTMLGNSKPKT